MTSSPSLVATPGARVRVSADLLGMLSARLTDRDRQIAQLLIDHQVLTATQVTTQLGFDSEVAARHRLVILHRRDCSTASARSARQPARLRCTT